jgi:hypothetical protein
LNGSDALTCCYLAISTGQKFKGFEKGGAVTRPSEITRERILKAAEQLFADRVYAEPLVVKGSALSGTVIVRMSARSDFMGSFQFGCWALGQLPNAQTVVTGARGDFLIADPAGRLCTAKPHPSRLNF